MKSLAMLSMALLVAGVAQAQGSTGSQDEQLQNRQAAGGTLTRAEVKAEMMRARAAGEIVDGEGGWPLTASPSMPSPMTRAEVRTELQRARAAGEIQNGEDVSYLFIQQAGTQRERAAVRAEAKEAARNHRQDVA
jgi:hypothetical protein